MEDGPDRAARPRRKFLKPALYSLAAGVLIAAGAIAYLVATFDPRDYHDRIVSIVWEKTGRTLDIRGDIALSFWPDLAVGIGALSLSERESGERFASVESARVRLELRPLLSRELVASELTIAGAKVRIVRNEDGRLNIDDLFKREGAPPRVDISRVTVERSALSFADLASGVRYELSDVGLETGRIAPGIATPVTLSLSARDARETFALKLGLKGRLELDFEQQRHALHDARAELSGRLKSLLGVTAQASGSVVARMQVNEVAVSTLSVSIKGTYAQEAFVGALEARSAVFAPGKAGGETMRAELAAKGPAGTTDLKLAAASVTREADRIAAPGIALNLALERGGHRIQGTLSAPLEVALAGNQISLDQLALDLTATGPRLPRPGVRTVVKGDARLDMHREGLAVRLAGKVADSRVTARLTMAGLASPVYTFAVEIDQLDLDRYATADSPSSRGAPRDTVPAPGRHLLEPLINVPATGTLTIGVLKTSGAKASNVRLVLK